ARSTPGAPASTAYRPNGTPSAGTSSTPASSASATPATVPVSLAWPGGSPGRAAATRTAAPGPAPPAPRPPGAAADGIRANSPATGAATGPWAGRASSAPRAPGSAAVATTAEPRYGTGATARPVSSATTAASR